MGRFFSFIFAFNVFLLAGAKLAAGQGLETLPPYAQNSQIDVISYDVKMTIPEVKASIVSAQVDIELKAIAKIESIDLHIEPSKISIGAIKILNEAVQFKVVGGVSNIYGLSGSVLKIQKTLAEGEKTHLAIDYQIMVNKDPKQYGLFFDGSYGGIKSISTRNWPYYARFWLPSNDHPNDTALFSIELSVPPTSVAAANGVLVAGDLQNGEGIVNGLKVFRWAQKTPIPTYGINVVAGDFKISAKDICYTLGQLGNTSVPCDQGSNLHKTPLSYYFPVALPNLAKFKKAVDLAEGPLVYFSNFFGKYPYEKLGFVSAPHPFNMESVSLITLISPEAATHEVVHHWWGNTVYIKHWGDLWISEGFTTFFTGFYNEFASGVFDSCTSDDGILNAKDSVDPMAIFDDTPYCKGSAALVDLRKRVALLASSEITEPKAKSIFIHQMQSLYNNYRFKTLSTKDLIQFLKSNLKSSFDKFEIPVSQEKIENEVSIWTDAWFSSENL